MHTAEKRVVQTYENSGFMGRMGFGKRPAVVVVDFCRAFTDPAISPLAANLDQEVAATRTLLDSARRQQVPVIYTTVEYDPDLKDAGLWKLKTRSQDSLIRGTKGPEIDPRLAPQPDEHILIKKFASAFFGTHLQAILRPMGVDTLLICGATTSGCVRATVVDSCQHGFYTAVVRKCVGDRAPGPHEANLFDMDAKYADVIPLSEALNYITRDS